MNHSQCLQKQNLKLCNKVTPIKHNTLKGNCFNSKLVKPDVRPLLVTLTSGKSPSLALRNLCQLSVIWIQIFLSALACGNLFRQLLKDSASESQSHSAMQLYDGNSPFLLQDDLQQSQGWPTWFYVLTRCVCPLSLRVGWRTSSPHQLCQKSFKLLSCLS